MGKGKTKKASSAVFFIEVMEPRLLLSADALASTVLSSLPAWQFLDPLPVLARVGSDDDEESLDSIIKQHEAAAGSPEEVQT